MRWRTALGLAFAELRGGARGLRVFAACLVIGVAAIAAAGSSAAAFRAGFAERARAILGGDLALSLNLQRPSQEVRAWFDAQGRTSEIIEARGMGAAGEVRRLVELRGLDAAHPLEGEILLADGARWPEAVAPVPGEDLPRAAIERTALAVFNIQVGDVLTVIDQDVRIAAIIDKEPDSLARGFAFAPRLLVRMEDFDRIGLIRPGGLYQSTLRVALPEGADLGAAKRDFTERFPDLARRLTDRNESASNISETIGRIEVFLTFVGLSSLLAGGIGIAGAMRGFLDARRGSIAVLKAFGASPADIRVIYGVQAGVLAGLAILLGLAIRAVAPILIAAVYGDTLPAPILAKLYPAPLASAGLVGALAAMAFAIGPLGAGRATPAAALFRAGDAGLGAPPPLERFLAVSLMAALALAAILTSADRGLALIFVAAAFVAFFLLAGLGHGARLLARQRAGHARGLWRIALASLGGPGSLAPAAAPAIGVGAALLIALIQIQANLVTQVGETAPERAPSIAFTEIPAAKADAFDAVITAIAGPQSAKTYQRTPILTARIVTLDGRSVAESKIDPAERWAVDGDVSVSFRAAPPDNLKLAGGDWWPLDYAGPPLVSFEVDAAKGLGLQLGSKIGFEVQGRPVEAVIGNLREVDWGGFGANFVAIFAPGALEGATGRHAAIAKLSPEQEEAITRALATDFPTVSVIRIRDALAAAAELLGSLATAIRAIALVAIAAGALAVAGALAAGAARRLYDAAILKALGATREEALIAFGLEQAGIGALAAGLGCGIGLAAAWYVIVQAFEADWRFAASEVLLAAGSIAAVLVALGLAAAFAAVSAPTRGVLQSAR